MQTTTASVSSSRQAVTPEIKRECPERLRGCELEECGPQAMPSTRHEPTICVFNGSIWLVAGNMWPLMNDVWRLTLPEGWEA